LCNDTSDDEDNDNKPTNLRKLRGKDPSFVAPKMAASAKVIRDSVISVTRYSRKYTPQQMTYALLVARVAQEGKVVQEGAFSAKWH
jgi:hypothetical protein